jgi:hypothetical protein
MRPPLQLTAAKLNLAATAELYPATEEASYTWCQGSKYTYMGKSINQFIAACEALYCPEIKTATFTPTIGDCITYLTQFNQEVDTLTDNETPEPFNHPGRQDGYELPPPAGADPRYFQAAQTGGVVIGKKLNRGQDCSAANKCPAPAVPEA